MSESSGGSGRSEGKADGAPARSSQPLPLLHPPAGWGSSAATPPDAPAPTATPGSAAVPSPAPEPAAGAAAAAPSPPTPLIEDGRLERCGLAALLLFCVQFLLGRRKNAALASGVAGAVTPTLRRHFAHVGPGAPPARGVEDENGEGEPARAPSSTPVMVRDAADAFSIQASGRRGLGLTTLTVRTRPRHDMLGLALALFDPTSATDTLEVTASLPSGLHPTVLVAGRSRAVRALGGHVADGGSPDVAGLAGAVSTAKARCGGSGASWPVSLVASADQAGVWHDLIAGGPLGALVASDPAAARALISVKVNTDGWGLKGGAVGGRAISASLALPPNPGGSEGSADLSPVVRLVEALLGTADALSAYRAPPEATAKAAKLRAEAGEREARREAAAAPAEARRAARAAAEAERLARMAPDAREKFLARKKRIDERRQLAKRTKRM